MHMGILAGADLGNANYRSYQPLNVLVRRGHTFARNRRDAPLPLPELLRCDVVHIHRAWTGEMVTVARRLRASGIGIVWDNDDDMLRIPRWNPVYRQLGAAGRREVATGVRDMVRLADVVTTPSAVLAEQYRELGADDVRVLENFLPPTLARTPRPKHDGVVIGCLASLEHHVDYERLDLHRVLRRLLDAHPDLRVMSAGLHLDLPHERYEHIRLVEFLDLAQTFARADVGLAPLVDIPFNRSRSNIKLKEYAAAGLAWLASPVGPYVGMGEQQGGRLVDDDGWYAAIKRLVVDNRERRKLAKRAAKWAKGQSVEQHADLWEAALRDAVVRGQARREREPMPAV